MSNSKTIHLVAAEFYPAYRGGRVERMRALAEYLHSKDVQTHIHSFSLRSMVASQFEGLKVTSYFSGSPCQQQTSPRSTMVGAWRVLAGLLKKLEGSPLLWDRYSYFVCCAMPRLRSALRPGDTVIISCPWFSPLLLSLYLLLTNTKVHLVIDYRDLWNGGPFQLKFGGKFFQERLQRFVLKRADLVTVTTRGQAEALARSYGVQPLVIKNGIRGSDARLIHAAQVKSRPPLPQASGVLIGYFGSVGGQRDLNLQLEQLTNLDSVRFVCVFGDVSRIAAPSDKILRRGFVTGELMGRELMKMDFLLISISAGEGAATAIPSKVFLYMATGKPLIVSAPENSELVRFLEAVEYPFSSLEELVCDADLWEQIKLGRDAFGARPLCILRELEFEKLMGKIAQW